MPAISKAMFDRVAGFPLAVPQTRLLPGSSVLIASVYVNPGRALRIRWLGLHVALASGADELDRIHSFYDTVYLGVFGGNFDQLNRPAGQPLLYVGVDGTGFSGNDPSSSLNLGTVGHYGLVLVNNTRSHTYECVVTGAAKLY